MVKLRSLVSTATIVLVGIVVLFRSTLTITPRVLKANGPIRQLHGTLWVWPDVGGLVPKGSTIGELVASTQACQTITAEYPGLFLVDIKFATFARANTGPVIFHLRVSPDAAEDLFTTTIEAADVEDNAYYSFEFPSLADSAGRTLYFCLEAPQAEPGNAITIWGATEDEYPNGEAVLVGLEDRGVRDLTFRLGYDPPLTVKAGILLDRLAANKPSLWGDKQFYIVLALAYLVLLYILFVWVMKVGVSGDESG